MMSLEHKTTLATIADHIAEMQTHNSEEAAHLLILMREYKEAYHRSYRNLMRIGGFRKLWDALEEMAVINSEPEERTKPENE